MIANYRVQAELSAVESTEDGKALVLGTVDGCVSVLAIIDTMKKDMDQYLEGMPSRDEGVSTSNEKNREKLSKNPFIALFTLNIHTFIHSFTTGCLTTTSIFSCFYTILHLHSC